MTWVLAAGNHSDVVANYSPARLQAAITVGATYTYAGSYDVRAGYSNIGPEVDLYAPGVAITSAYFTGDYAAAECSGTSMAAPQVAGVVARFLQVYWWAPPGHVTIKSCIRTPRRASSGTLGAYTPNRLLYSGFMDQ